MATASAVEEEKRKSSDRNDSPTIQILVYRNGDEYDPGTEIIVSRKQLKNWLAFLEFVTQRIQLHGAVNKIYTMEGVEVRHFRELQHLHRYIGARHNVHMVHYGTRIQKPWSKDDHVKYKDYTGIDSADSSKIYLESNKFKPNLGDMWDDPEFDQKVKVGKNLSFKARPAPKFPNKPVLMPKGRNPVKKPPVGNDPKFVGKTLPPRQQSVVKKPLESSKSDAKMAENLQEILGNFGNLFGNLLEDQNAPANDYVPLSKAKSEVDVRPISVVRGYTPTNNSRPGTVKSEPLQDEVFHTSMGFREPSKLSRTPSNPNKHEMHQSGKTSRPPSSVTGVINHHSDLHGPIARDPTSNGFEKYENAPGWAKELKMAVLNLEKAVEKIDPKELKHH